MPEINNRKDCIVRPFLLNGNIVFRNMLSLNHATAKESLAIVPRCELACGDTTLGFVEEYIYTILFHYEFCSLQWLAIADAHIVGSALANFHSIYSIDPMYLTRGDTQGFAVESWVVVALAHEDGIMLNIRRKSN